MSPGHLLQQATHLLGRRPTAAAAAPGRVNLIGEHTDYNDGFVLPLAITQRTVCAIAPRDDGTIVARSTSQGSQTRFGVAPEPGEVSGWAAYVAGTIWSLRQQGLDLPDGGLDIAIASDVWPGAGLSSSAALESAVAIALGADDLPIGAADDRAGLAAALQRAENAYVGAATGIMDQSASLRCRPDHLLLLDCRTLAVEHVPLDLPAAGLALMIMDSRAPHQHAGGEYEARRRDCEAAAAALDVRALRDVDDCDALDRAPGLSAVQRARARHVVSENARVLEVVDLLRSGTDPREIGPALTASHASMRDDFQITVPQVDVIADAAAAAGAHGARMTGGGFGGCVIALVDKDAVAGVRERVAAAARAAGHAEPRIVTVTPGAGALTLTLPNLSPPAEPDGRTRA